jgi:hypothetical protein
MLVWNQSRGRSPYLPRFHKQGGIEAWAALAGVNLGKCK